MSATEKMESKPARSNTGTDLEPRRLPSQDRSRRRVDAILDALAELLVERGFEAVNTHQVAERAGVPVGTLYQFFPNKYALVRALSRRYIERYSELLQASVPPHSEHVTTEALLDRFTEVIAATILEDKVLAVLWAVTQATPELFPVMEEGMAMSHALIRGLLEESFGHLEERKLESVAKTVNRVSYALVYAACQESGPDKRDVLEELKRLQNAYLRSYLTES